MTAHGCIANNAAMVAVSRLQMSKKDLFEKAGRFNTLVNTALCRENAAPSEMTIRRSVEGGRSREKIVADFTKAANLVLLDDHIMPVIQRLLARARDEQMSAVPRVFSQQALYAIDVLGSVAAKDFDEISDILYPRPKIILGQVCAFPQRTA